MELINDFIRYLIDTTELGCNSCPSSVGLKEDVHYCGNGDCAVCWEMALRRAAEDMWNEQTRLQTQRI